VVEMTKPEEIDEQLIETIDEDGNVINFELLDIIEFEGKEYGLLLPKEETAEKEKEVILMRLIKEGEEYIFEVIEDDDEFNKVVEFIDTLEEDQ
jgi:uncharacterized protein YrzB (UPF0473 family)